MRLEQRIERLERQNRHLRCGVVGAAVLVVASLMMGQATLSRVLDVLRAYPIEVIGDHGQPIVRLDRVSDHGHVWTCDPHGREILVLAATVDGDGMLYTFNAQGQKLIQLAATESGKGAIVAYNVDGKRELSWP